MNTSSTRRPPARHFDCEHPVARAGELAREEVAAAGLGAREHAAERLGRVLRELGLERHRRRGRRRPTREVEGELGRPLPSRPAPLLPRRARRSTANARAWPSRVCRGPIGGRQAEQAARAAGRICALGRRRDGRVACRTLGACDAASGRRRRRARDRERNGRKLGGYELNFPVLK